MIVGSYFHGDSTRIGLMQHGCYGEALHINFASAKHCKAERVVSVRTELSDLRDELISFDHRTYGGCMIVWQPRSVWSIVLMRIFLLIRYQTRIRPKKL